MDKKYLYIIGGIILIIVLFYLNSLVKKIKAQPTYIAPFNPQQQPLTGQGATNPQGLQVSMSDAAIQDLASRLYKKIDGLTWWGWDEPILKEALSMSDYDLARLNAAYKKLSGNDLDVDLENEQTGLITPTGANARKLIERLRNIKYKV